MSNKPTFEDFQYIKVKMRDEGFHYCFKHFSRFEEINDKEFQKMRKKYLKWANKLEEYVNEKSIETNE
jgi:hypothetical protein